MDAGIGFAESTFGTGTRAALGGGGRGGTTGMSHGSRMGVTPSFGSAGMTLPLTSTGDLSNLARALAGNLLEAGSGSANGMLAVVRSIVSQSLDLAPVRKR